MATSQIIAQIKNKDWTFTEEATDIDPAAAPELLPLCDDEDAEIRELALFAINNIPGEEARNCIIKALRDDDINVRSTASRFLRSNYSKEDVEKLHAELSTNDDEFVRESVLLVLGLIGEPSSIKVIEKHAIVEQDAHAAHAVHLAMVRLQDDSHRRQYADRLGDDDPKKRVQALQDFEYIQDRYFLSQIVPLLSDENKGLNVGPSKSKIWLRVCDVAVNILDKVLNHPFDFEVGDVKNYTQQERIDTANIVQGIQP